MHQELFKSVEELVPQSPTEELYEMYAQTITDRFPSFLVRELSSVRDELDTPLLIRNREEAVEPWLIDAIATKESRERFLVALEQYLDTYSIDEWLQSGSIVFGVDHGQFTDVPITSELFATLCPEKREHIFMVVSKMVDLLQLPFGELDVIPQLQKISHIIQTVPRLDRQPSKRLLKKRQNDNEDAKEILTRVLSQPGSVLVQSLIGRHNKPSDDGETLYIHEPNLETFRLMSGKNVLLIPLYIHCHTFGSDGSITPAELAFQFFPPIDFRDVKPRSVIKQQRIANQVTENFRQATEGVLGRHYPGGIEIKSWQQQKLERLVGSVGVRQMLDGSDDD